MNGEGGARPVRKLWLLERRGEPEVLTIAYRRAGEVLPVLSFEEEARDFLSLLGGFRAAEKEARELAALLAEGPLAGVRGVLLDPPVGMDSEEVLELISLSRERFVEQLLGAPEALAAVRA